jgi:hypothetical protein
MESPCNKDPIRPADWQSVLRSLVKLPGCLSISPVKCDLAHNSRAIVAFNVTLRRGLKPSPLRQIAHLDWQLAEKQIFSASCSDISVQSMRRVLTKTTFPVC